MSSFPWVEIEEYYRPEDEVLSTTEKVCSGCHLIGNSNLIDQGQCPNCPENF